MQKNATQSTVVRMNNKRKYAHQMRANARKRVFTHAFFNTRLRKSCACVLRVRWPLISDLYCMDAAYARTFTVFGLFNNLNAMHLVEN